MKDAHMVLPTTGIEITFLAVGPQGSVAGILLRRGDQYLPLLLQALFADLGGEGVSPALLNTKIKKFQSATVVVL